MLVPDPKGQGVCVSTSLCPKLAATLGNDSFSLYGNDKSAGGNDASVTPTKLSNDEDEDDGIL